ncbi:MAG: hypothetical protein K8R54_11235 [Bacteroidales bacterium]|nr:hypothetical protein [Bacteroidales bacterium]
MLLVSKKDFFDEIEFLFNYLNGKELTKQVFWDAFFEQGKSHLNEFGRMIDYDLEGYIDRIMKIIDTIQPFLEPLTVKINLRKEFRERAFNVFKNYIYINKMNSFGQVSLML